MGGGRGVHSCSSKNYFLFFFSEIKYFTIVALFTLKSQSPLFEMASKKIPTPLWCWVLISCCWSLKISFRLLEDSNAALIRSVHSSKLFSSIKVGQRFFQNNKTNAFLFLRLGRITQLVRSMKYFLAPTSPKIFRWDYRPPLRRFRFDSRDYFIPRLSSMNSNSLLNETDVVYFLFP